MEAAGGGGGGGVIGAPQGLLPGGCVRGLLPWWVCERAAPLVCVCSSSPARVLCRGPPVACITAGAARCIVLVG